MTTLLRETLKNASIYMPIPARIVRIETLTPVEKLYKIELPSGFSLDHRPGQFVEVSILGIGEAPISICSSPSRSNGTFELCVRKVGKLTEAIHRMKPGAMIGIRGPFGRPFPVDRFAGKDLLLVAGGLGIAPLKSVIDEVLDHRGHFGRVIIAYGARSPQDMLFTSEVAAWDARDDVEVFTTVDYPAEGWTGNVGMITSLIPQIEFDGRHLVSVTIGPPIMYRYVVKELLKRHIPEGNIWMSFERQMKCAVGKCGHCQMHHIYTCQYGPSFTYLEVKDLEEAFG